MDDDMLQVGVVMVFWSKGTYATSEPKLGPARFGLGLEIII